MSGLDKEIYELISREDGAIAIDAVKRVTKFDLGDGAKDVSSLIKLHDLKNAIRTQWEMIGRLTRTVVHLEKQNILMEADYERQGKGRKKGRK
jgi:hypothetical protein